MNKDYIYVTNTHIEIPNYRLGSYKELERDLSVWDDATHKFNPMGYYYDKDNTLKIPRGIDLSTLTTTLGRRNIDIIEPNAYDKINIELMTQPRSVPQRKSLAYLTSKSDFDGEEHPQKLLNLGTGEGKTYVTVAAIAKLGIKPIIITHLNKLKEQWRDAFTKFTTISSDQICMISSSDHLYKILNNPDDNHLVYIVNHRTLQSFYSNIGWEYIDDHFTKLGIGIKVYDEAHLEFANILRIDLNTNVYLTIYLTATFARSDRNEFRLFKIFSNSIAKYGHSLRKDMRKHITYLAAMYNTHPTMIDQHNVYTAKGISHFLYMRYQFSKPNLENILFMVMDRFVPKYAGKVLVLTDLIEHTEYLCKEISDRFKDKICSAYHSKVPMSEKKWILSNADIIVTTPKSMGVGVHIDGLRIVIMAGLIVSSLATDQISGRLREYSPTNNTLYVELLDKGFPEIMKSYKSRNKLMRAKCLKIFEYDIAIPFGKKKKGKRR